MNPLSKNPSEQPTVIVDPPEGAVVPGGRGGRAGAVRDDGAPVGHRGEGDGPGRNPWPGVARTAIVGLVIVVVLLGGLVIVLEATGRALSSLNPFRDGVVENVTVDRSGPVVVRSITEMGELKAASGDYQVVVDVENDVRPLPSFLAGERTLFVAAGTVDATVDLRAVGEDDVVVSEDGTAVTITVPTPQVGDPAMDLSRSRVWGRDRGLIDRLKDAFGDDAGDDPTEIQGIYRLGEQKIAEAASASPDLVNRAEASTTSTLQGLLRALGYTDVTVVFEPPDER